MNKNISGVPGNDRPYERCLAYGPGVLSDTELLAVMIRTGTGGLNAEDIARKVLSMSLQDQKLLGLCHMDAEELMAIPGIGKVKAVQIMCIAELSKRIAAYKAMDDISFSDPATISDYYMERLRHEEQEMLVCMMLDTKNHILREKVMTKGTVCASLISPREIFLEALKFHAVNVIIVHNHPGGDPSPSPADIDVTERIKEAGELLDIRLVDHIIVGDRSYFSFRQEDML